MAEGVGGDPEVIEHSGLLPGSDLEALLEWTADQSSACRQVAWVGHAPDVGRLAGALVSSSDGWLRFAKGAVAAIRFHGMPAAGDGELRWLVTAKLLGC